jgi:hypothetical protein
MSKIKELIVEAVLPVIRAVGKAEMEILLSGVKDHNTDEVYKKILRGVHADFSLLKEAALKSKTKIDDGIVDLVLEAVMDRADADGIVLL